MHEQYVRLVHKKLLKQLVFSLTILEYTQGHDFFSVGYVRTTDMYIRDQ
jgi:hypothetical protein